MDWTQTDVWRSRRRVLVFIPLGAALFGATFVAGGFAFFGIFSSALFVVTAGPLGFVAARLLSDRPWRRPRLACLALFSGAWVIAGVLAFVLNGFLSLLVSGSFAMPGEFWFLWAGAPAAAILATSLIAVGIDRADRTEAPASDG